MPASQSPCALQPCLQANTGAACRPAWKNWIRWLFLALLCAPIFAAELPDETGKKAEIQLTLLNGDRFDLQQLAGYFYGDGYLLVDSASLFGEQLSNNRVGIGHIS